jgi:hypothetical protein
MIIALEVEPGQKIGCQPNISLDVDTAILTAWAIWSLIAAFSDA